MLNSAVRRLRLLRVPHILAVGAMGVAAFEFNAPSVKASPEFTPAGSALPAGVVHFDATSVPGDTPIPRKPADVLRTLHFMDDLRADSTREDRVLAALRIANYLLARYSDDAGVLWRAARAYYDLAKERPDLLKAEFGKDATSDGVLDLALKLLRDAKATQAGRGDNNVFRWAGIVLNERGKSLGTKEYIQNAFIIRDDWVQAIAINSSDATATHLLGRWSLDVASMSWVTRKLASTLFAAPPTATLDEALSYFRRAEAIQPGFWCANQYYLGVTLEKLGEREEAKRWYVSALDLPVSTGEDKTSHGLALAALEKIDAAAAGAAKQRDAARGIKL